MQDGAFYCCPLFNSDWDTESPSVCVCVCVWQGLHYTAYSHIKRSIKRDFALLGQREREPSVHVTIQMLIYKSKLWKKKKVFLLFRL